MRRVDRLLLKIQEAQRLDEMQLAVALIGKRTEMGSIRRSMGRESRRQNRAAYNGV